MIPRPGKSGTDERGIALILALFTMVIIGALVGSSFFLARLEQQSGQNVLFAAQAGDAAEMGLSDAVASGLAMSAELAVGQTLALDTLIGANGVMVSRQIIRLTSGLILIRSHGVRQTSTGHVLATRSAGLVVEVAETGVHPIERGWLQMY